jgi:hypothetical protein
MVAVGLTACTTTANSAPVDQVSAVTVEASPIVTASLTPTPSLTPTSTATITPTRSFELPTSQPPSDRTTFDLFQFIFDEGVVQGCHLPCWRGLIVGDSSYRDVAYVFDATFGPEGQNNIGLSSLQQKNKVAIPQTIGYLWGLEDWNNGEFRVTSIMDSDSQKLEVLSFQWYTGDTSELHFEISLQHVVRMLGQPREMLAHVESVGLPAFGILHVLLVYDQGMAFEFASTIPVTTILNPDLATISELIGSYCFANTQTSDEMWWLSGRAYLVESTALAGESSEPAGIRALVYRYPFKPVEDIFGRTAEQIVQQIDTMDGLCLETVNLKN